MLHTEEMLKYLEGAFPDRCPDLTKVSEKEALILFGKIKLIQLIRFKLEEAQETTPEVLT
jgi:hypothetical protein